MAQIKIAIIGIGQIAQNFHLPILYRQSNIEIAVLCDKNLSKVQVVAEKYGIKNYTDKSEDVFNNEDIKAVFISTSTDAHCELALAAIEAGKHVFIEKPIARNLNEAIQIQQAALNSDLMVMIATNQRFRYDARMIKNYIQMKEIGDVFYTQCGWIQPIKGAHWRKKVDKAGGGVLFDLGYSLIDSLLWLNDYAPIKSVQASLFHHLTKSVEDVVVGTIRYKNNSIATLELSWSLFLAKSDFYYNVHGSKGSVKINPLQLYKISGDSFEPIQHKDALSKVSIHKKSFESEIKHFVLALHNHGTVVSTPTEAVEVMKVIDAMYRSAELGKEIVL